MKHKKVIFCNKFVLCNEKYINYLLINAHFSYENGHNWYVIQTVVSMAASHCARPIERCVLFIARIANGFANFKMCSNVVFFVFVSCNCVCLANFPQSFTMFGKPLSQLFFKKSHRLMSLSFRTGSEKIHKLHMLFLVVWSSWWICRKLSLCQIEIKSQNFKRIQTISKLHFKFKISFQTSTKSTTASKLVTT